MLLLNNQPRGEKRKLHSDNNNLLAKQKTAWLQRKPKHLKVCKGFLPNDDLYKATKITNRNFDDYLDDLDNPNQRHLLDNRSKYMYYNKEVYVIDYIQPSPAKRIKDKFSKFHSLLQVLVGLYDEDEKCFVPRKLALLASNTLSNTHDSIFDLNQTEFVYEYQYMKRVYPYCAISWVEKGVVLLTKSKGLYERVRGNELLRFLYKFLKKHRLQLSTTKSAIAFINKECLTLRSNSKLHFDCLCLLMNAEGEALRSEGYIIKQKRFSAFDLLQDVWICCFNNYLGNYCLRYLSKETWEKYNNGLDLTLQEFSKEVTTQEQKQKLSHFAAIAANHYDFYGITYVMTEDSHVYQQFRTNRINA
tara:strand:+ start:361 stop:1440 length:1080 start_codon:yes stop_codon:yes gene_type:complete